MNLLGFDLDFFRQEINKIRDLKTFKAELAKLGQELLKWQDHLGPNAKKNVAVMEKRYKAALKSIHATQKEFDRELHKARTLFEKTLEQTRAEVDKRLAEAKKAAADHKEKLSQAFASGLNKAKTKAQTKAQTKTETKTQSSSRKAAKRTSHVGSTSLKRTTRSSRKAE